jgi:regulator of sirC expression with transglutaminase-like and TPR domain
MQALTIQQPVHALTERQRSALISLLADEDPGIYRMVRGQIMSFGAEACLWLRPHLLSGDPLMRRRSLEIVSSLGRRFGDEHFFEFCSRHGEEFDIEKGMELLVQTQYPDVNFEAYRALWDLWASELRDTLEPGNGPEYVLRQINHLLFEVLGFTGQEGANNNPENCYLNRVMDRRQGNSISLSIVYLLLAKRLQLPVCGLGLPGHFICRYQTPTQDWYIDAFRRGKFWTKSDCMRYMLSAQGVLGESALRPMSSRRILQQVCATLGQAYAHLEMPDEAARLSRYLLALSK